MKHSTYFQITYVSKTKGGPRNIFHKHIIVLHYSHYLLFSKRPKLHCFARTIILNNFYDETHNFLIGNYTRWVWDSRATMRRCRQWTFVVMGPHMSYINKRYFCTHRATWTHAFCTFTTCEPVNYGNGSCNKKYRWNVECAF